MTYAENADNIRAALALIDEDVAALAAAATADVASLTRWKVEASTVLSGWEDVYVALGSPGPLGAVKSAAALDAVRALQTRIAELTNVTPPPVDPFQHRSPRP